MALGLFALELALMEMEVERWGVCCGGNELVVHTTLLFMCFANLGCLSTLENCRLDFSTPLLVGDLSPAIDALFESCKVEYSSQK